MLEIKFKNNIFSKLTERDEKEMYNFGGESKGEFISKPEENEKVFLLRFHPYKDAMAAIFCDAAEDSALTTMQTFPEELKEILHNHYERLLIMAEKPSIWEVKPTASYGLELFGKDFYMRNEDSLSSTEGDVVMVFAACEDHPHPYLIVNGEEVPTKLRDKGLSTGGMCFDVWELAEGVGVVLAHTNTMLPMRLPQIVESMTNEGIETRGVFQVHGKNMASFYDDETGEFFEECHITTVTWL